MTKTIRILIVAAALGCFALPAAHAAKQHVCPVSGDALDSDVGPPIPVTANGKTILFCCKSCVKKYRANPEKYSAAVQKTLGGN